MKPSLRQLQYLVAISETGTMSEAAARTFVSQPSLSIQLKDMEAQLGAALVERSRKGAILTPLGEDIVVRARLILRQVEDLKALAKEASGTLAGQIKLGVLPTVGPYLLPRATRQLHARYPELRLTVHEESSRDLDAHLSEGRFDVIISTPSHQSGIHSHALLEENIYICVAPDDPLARESGPVKLKALKGRECLTLGPDNAFAAAVSNLAELAGATTGGGYAGTSLDAIRQMASMGGSVAVLPSLYAISEAKRDPGLIVRKIDHTTAQRQIALVWRETSPMAEKFSKIATVFSDVATQIMA